MEITSERAYFKLQSLNSQEIYVRRIPVRLGYFDQKYQNQNCADCQIPLVNLEKCKTLIQDQCIIYYNLVSEKFYIIAFTSIFIDDVELNIFPDPSDLYDNIQQAEDLTVFQQYDEYACELKDYSKIYFPCEEVDCEIPHIYYFILPGSEQQQTKGLFLKTAQLCGNSSNMLNPNNKIHDKQLYYKWLNDDRDNLKRQILQYGYGRWRAIQKSSLHMMHRLCDKQKSELRTFSNAFIRSLAELITPPNQDLKNFLYSIIEEYPDDNYIQPDPKDWDLQGQQQRAIAYTKRIQLLYRIKLLIKRFKQDQLKVLKDKTHIIWESLLNFLPNSLLYGQKPSVWWAKKHDTDLIRGIYTFGYANYQAIKSCNDYCFQELMLTNTFSEFPSSDTLTRRLKKLIATIIKNEEDKGEIDFNQQADSEDDVQGWSGKEKKYLFEYLTNYGVPLNNEGRNNWLEIRENMMENVANFDKSVSQIEKMVQKIRMECQRLIIQHENKQTSNKSNSNNQQQSTKLLDQLKQDVLNQPKIEEEQNQQYSKETKLEDQEDFQIQYDQAIVFNKNTNMIQYIRKEILISTEFSIESMKEDIIKEHNIQILQNKPNIIRNDDYQHGIHDLKLLTMVSEKGFSSLQNKEIWKEYDFEKLKNLEIIQLEQRLQWLCKIFRQLKENLINLKKRKSDKVYKDDVRKKPKFEIQRDENGQIIYPIQVNGSLTLLNIGTICTLPTYHSEHNLFPIGFKTIRSHPSMFNRGQRANYTCEILEGSDGRPLYKVISDEEPDRPIIKDSSTGCWVHVCSRVNNLQENKKDKVTISGTERFGLLETHVVRLLESLENSEKCIRYKFKYRNPYASNMEGLD